MTDSAMSEGPELLPCPGCWNSDPGDLDEYTLPESEGGHTVRECTACLWRAPIHVWNTRADLAQSVPEGVLQRARYFAYETILLDDVEHRAVGAQRVLRDLLAHLDAGREGCTCAALPEPPDDSCPTHGGEPA